MSALVQLYTGSKSVNYLFQTDKYGKHKIVVSGAAVQFKQSYQYIKIKKKTTVKISAPKLTAKKGTNKYFKVTVKKTQKPKKLFQVLK